MNYFGRRNRFPPLTNQSSERQGVSPTSGNVHTIATSPCPTRECKRFKFTEALQPLVTPSPHKPLTVQTHLLREEDEEVSELMQRLCIRRNDQSGTKGSYFAEETYCDPEEEPLESFMAYENVWWPTRPWGAKQMHRRRRSGDVFF